MKTLKLTVVAIVLGILMSCGNGISKQPANAEGFAAIESELKSKFGANAYYTDLKIVYINGVGNAISVTVTAAPESLKMGQWELSENSWEQSSEITLEVPEGSKAAEFMFQLNDSINLTKLGSLVEKSNKQLTSEKNIENPTLDIAIIKFPRNGDMAKTEYYIKLKPKKGDTSFSFSYKMNGDLIKMNY